MSSICCLSSICHLIVWSVIGRRNVTFTSLLGLSSVCMVCHQTVQFVTGRHDLVPIYMTYHQYVWSVFSKHDPSPEIWSATGRPVVSLVHMIYLIYVWSVLVCLVCHLIVWSVTGSYDLSPVYMILSNMYGLSPFIWLVTSYRYQAT